MKDKNIENDVNVTYLAQLARLDFEKEEVKVFQNQLKQIIEYVRKISEVNVEGIEPMSHVVPMYNVFRKDEVGAELAHEIAMNNAPESRDGLFIVPRIIEE
jgi:aspartyl-tRNA(Asn)/glutamyl-tRNA(Gln) amidotransferase subunit C